MAANAKGKRVVIVESPAKARTIAGYLGDGFVVESSVGHIRDLPQRAAEIPAKHKKEPWARLGVNIENDFEPLYVVDADKKKTVELLKKRVAEADEVLLATDEDREGEAIAWHLLEVLKPKVPVSRMVFHEITRDAISRALDETRPIDERLVDAQETRRILDRLYGYEVSPVLWKKIMQGLSAGRVQSVATRLVVERERERMAFVRAAWWDIRATFAPDPFEAQLSSLDGRRIATGRDIGPDGKLRDEALLQLDEETARGLAERLQGVPFHVRSVESKPYSRRPSPPFMTSTLQQEASRKLRYTAQTTMRIAQRLYENGYITYMRTDSTTLSDSALKAARAQAAELYGSEYVAAQPRRYERKVKNAQEAHEAIRPAGDTFRTPQQVAGELSPDERALYELIWIRTIASQMADAKGETVSVRIAGTSSAEEVAEFAAAGTVITFRGFLAAYEEGRDDKAPTAPGREEAERRLPHLTEGQELEAARLEPAGHETSPPARYTEATLVRALEERGIGRPSTYASIIGTILDRGYVFKKDSALVPSFLAFAVIGLLEQHFGKLVDYDFTARMEDDLDRIAAGDEERVSWLRRFYYGDGDGGLKELVEDLGGIDAREISSVAIGNGIVLRVGRYGAYLERDGQRANVPDDVVPDELTVEKAEELLSQPSGERVARRRSRDRPRDHRAQRPLRAVRERGRRRGFQGERADRLAALEPVAGDGHARGGAPAPGAAAARRHRARRRGGARAHRALRAVRPEGEGDALARARGAGLRDHARRGARPARPAEGARPRRREAAAARARRRPLDRQARRPEGGPLWPVRHRRRDQREPARRRFRRVGDHRARVRAARRATLERPDEASHGKA